MIFTPTKPVYEISDDVASGLRTILRFYLAESKMAVQRYYDEDGGVWVTKTNPEYDALEFAKSFALQLAARLVLRDLQDRHRPTQNLENFDGAIAQLFFWFYNQKNAWIDFQIRENTDSYSSNSESMIEELRESWGQDFDETISRVKNWARS